MTHPLSLGCAVAGAFTTTVAAVFGEQAGERNATCCKVALVASLALHALSQSLCETQEEGAGLFAITLFGAGFAKLVVWDGCVKPSLFALCQKRGHE